MAENNFENFWANIESSLKKYEKYRIFLFVLAIMPGCFLAAVLVFLFLKGYLSYERAYSAKIVYMAAIFGMFIFWSIKKFLEGLIKSEVIGKFFECFADFNCSYWNFGNSLIDETTLKSAKILPQFSESYSDDNFQGNYKGIPITISEQRLKSGVGIYKLKVFDGIVIKYFLENKHFPAEVVIRDAGMLPPKGLQKIVLEDTEFNKMFSVYSNDQIESRFVLTTGFMEKLKALKILFGAKHTAVYLNGRTLFIAVDIGHDSFNVAKLTGRIDDREQFEKMYNQFNFILNIADLLSLTNHV